MDSSIRAAVALSALLICFAHACSSGGNKKTSADAGAGSLPTFELRPAHPLTVAVATDTAHAVTATIPITGGTIAATGADGTIYSLVIPDKALIDDTDITLTPVTAVQGLPLSGGLQAAVQVAPEGLQLYQLGTLTIVPAKKVSADQQIAFAYQGTGAEFHLQPLQIASGVALKIMHFSGYGTGQGTGGDASAQQSNAPTAPMDQYQQQAEQLVREERAAELLGQEPDPNFGKKLASIEQSFYDQVVAPALAKAEASSDPAVVAAALSVAISFAKEAEVLGTASSYPTLNARIQALIVKLAQLKFQAAYDKCVKQHDLLAIDDMIVALRAAYMIGATIPGADLQKAQSCLTLRLDFVSSNTSKVHSGGTSAHPILTYDLNTASFKGEGTLYWDFMNVICPPCTCPNTALPSGTFSVQKLRLIYDRQAPGGPRLKDVELVIASPDIAQSFTAICPPAPPALVTMPTSFWTGCFVVLYRDRLITGFGFRFTGWQTTSIPADPLLALKGDRPPDSGDCTSASTSFELFHSPPQ